MNLCYLLAITRNFCNNFDRNSCTKVTLFNKYSFYLLLWPNGAKRKAFRSFHTMHLFPKKIQKTAFYNYLSKYTYVTLEILTKINIGKIADRADMTGLTILTGSLGLTALTRPTGWQVFQNWMCKNVEITDWWQYTGTTICTYVARRSTD